MSNKAFMILGVLALLCTSEGAWAGCPLSGGGGGSSGGIGGGYRGGGVGSVRLLGGSGKRTEPKKKEVKKHELPTAEVVATLDTSKFDAFSVSLDLTAEQQEKIAKLKSTLAENAKRLSDAQDAARQAYSKAASDELALAAAGEVQRAAAACRTFAPTRDFESGVQSVLTHAQKLALRQAMAKVAASAKKPS